MKRRALFLIGILAALALTLALTALIMRPPRNELTNLGAILALTALGSGALGFLVHRLGWWRRPPTLKLSLSLGYLLAALLTILNVWVGAQLMFISEHDLALAGMLLLFASGISVSFGYLISSGLVQALGDILQASERLSEGDLTARVPAGGSDEVARLGASFNQMASRLEAAAQEARRMEAARRDFVAGASHDLRTPLASLQAMIEALAEGVVDDPDTVQRYLRQSQAEILRLRGLTDDLFQLAQLDAGHFAMQYEPASLSDLVSDSLGSLSPRAAAKGLTVSGWVDPQVGLVWMAPLQVGRILHNLLDNALAHTPEGGTIAVRAAPEGGSVLISVQDSGEGISAEDLPRVFERFYRGEQSRSRSAGGTGLGLAIAKGLVEAHGGEIWVDSRPGSGACFRFSLPLAPSSAAEPGGPVSGARPESYNPSTAGGQR
ncbi:MAG TPA: HAMP domain-containing sensor histidine kinase [Anaerolineales bacterium]